MKQFLMLLLFHKTLLLTAVPIDLIAGVEQRIQGSVSAINAEASFQLQIPLRPPSASSLAEFEKQLVVAHPPGAIEVTVAKKNGELLRFRSTGRYTYSADDVRLVLTSDVPLPVDDRLQNIVIRSAQTIRGARLYWENGRV